MRAKRVALTAVGRSTVCSVTVGSAPLVVRRLSGRVVAPVVRDWGMNGKLVVIEPCCAAGFVTDSIVETLHHALM